MWMATTPKLTTAMKRISFTGNFSSFLVERSAASAVIEDAVYLATDWS
jgi:hypothetical protein